MYTRCLLTIITISLLLASCSTGRLSVGPYKKYSPATLQRDYAIFRQTLEEAHPGLYWYTSKDSMDYYFDWGQQQLKDSLTEPEFRQVLTYVAAQINCGHTTIRSSKNYARMQDSSRIQRIFPLSLKLWNDTAVVGGHPHTKEKGLTKGDRILAINEVPINTITDSLFQFISTDGFNRTHKYQVLSNRGFFGSLYSSVYGYSMPYTIRYADSLNVERDTTLFPYIPANDTAGRRRIPQQGRTLPAPSPQQIKESRLNSVRLLKLDTAGKAAMMDLHSFGRGYGLKGFFRRSFRNLKKYEIRHLIIDVRGNGGGSVTNSTFISRYIANKPFRVADSLYAVAKRKKYSRYIESDFFNRLFISLFAGKKKDGLYHFRYFERHRFKPRKKNHFDGKVYIVTGGNSFSATTLFANAVKEQENVIIAGEETGGGAYGNSAWLIPDVTLPGTGVRFRLPLFRLVINKDLPKDGRGVQPEVYIGPTIPAIRRGADFKMEKVMQFIAADDKPQQ